MNATYCSLNDGAMVTVIKADESGFPHGYFVIRSIAQQRVLDVERRSAVDGTEILLWPERENSLVEGECQG